MDKLQAIAKLKKEGLDLVLFAVNRLELFDYATERFSHLRPPIFHLSKALLQMGVLTQAQSPHWIKTQEMMANADWDELAKFYAGSTKSKEEIDKALNTRLQKEFSVAIKSNRVKLYSWFTMNDHPTGLLEPQSQNNNTRRVSIASLTLLGAPQDAATEAINPFQDFSSHSSDSYPQIEDLEVDVHPDNNG